MSVPLCDHGALPGKCEEEGCIYRVEVRNAILGLAGKVAAQGDQAQAMTDAELGALLLTGRWTTIEVHEAGRRLVRAGGAEGDTAVKRLRPGFYQCGDKMIRRAGARWYVVGEPVKGYRTLREAVAAAGGAEGDTP